MGIVYTYVQYTHKKLTVAYVDCVTWFNIWGARIGSTFQGNLEEWCIKFLFSLCTTYMQMKTEKNVMSGLFNCCFMTGFKSIKAVLRTRPWSVKFLYSSLYTWSDLMICFDSELFPQNFVWQLNNDRKSLDLYYGCLRYVVRGMTY